MNLLAFVLLSCIYVTIMADRPKQLELSDAPKLFEDFVRENNRQYKDDEDRQKHYEAFVQNMQKINEHNAKSETATYGINKFADYTEEERKQMFGLKRP